jgi:hypothetical protein
VPHSIFTGRVRQPDEPLFTAEDTDAAVALAEEEADTCSQCGQPKAWCRDAANHQFSFEAVASVCWATEALETYKKTSAYQGLKDTVRAATQVAPKWREGHDPDLVAGLGLDDLG